jgi:poly(3-hydroxybutyrate) depolymerase
MGGYFSHHLACNGPTGDDGLPLVRAIAAHSGGTYDAPCDHPPVPVMVLHGDADTLIDVTCGAQARDLWVARNGCGGEADVQAVEGGECAYQLDCPVGGEVAMCTFFGMNHGWAGAEYTGPWITFQYGGGTEYEEAAALSWAFFAESG